MRIYLDNCCYNRPFDNQKIRSNHIDTVALSYIRADIQDGKYELVWSFILDYENSANPFDDRRAAAREWRASSRFYCPANVEMLEFGRVLEKSGIHKKDALHLACAIKSECEYFITTDKKLINKPMKALTILSPKDFIERMEEII